MANEYVALLNCKLRPIPFDEIEKVLDKAKDWLRYQGNIWFLVSDQSANYWYGKLKAVLHEDDNVIVIKVDPTAYQGWGDAIVREYFLRDHVNRVGD